MALTWDDIFIDRIRRFITDNFLLNTASPADNEQTIRQMSREALQQWLHDRGVLPTALFPAAAPVVHLPPVVHVQAPAVHVPAAPAGPPGGAVKVEAPKQSLGEDVADFLDRLVAFFTVMDIPINDPRRLAFLTASMLPACSVYVAQLIAANTHDYTAVTAALVTRFGATSLQYLQQFEALRVAQTDNSMPEFVLQLRRLYIRYLGLREATITPEQLQVVDKAVQARFLRVVPLVCKSSLQQLIIDNPACTLLQLAARAEVIIDCQPRTRGGPQGRQPHNGGTGPGSRRPRPGQATQDQGSFCYVCHSPDHMARDCPNRRQDLRQQQAQDHPGNAVGRR